MAEVIFRNNNRNKFPLLNTLTVSCAPHVSLLQKVWKALKHQYNTVRYEMKGDVAVEEQKQSVPGSGLALSGLGEAGFSGEDPDSLIR